MSRIVSPPLVSVALVVLGGIFLCASAFLGVTALADWTVLAAEALVALAACLFLGWFIVGCAAEIRR